MRSSALSITFGLVVALTGCAATGPAFAPATPPATDQTLVYIYRVNSFFGKASSASFAIDGAEAATLNVDGYTRFYVKSGHRAMTVSFSIAAFPDQHRALHFPPGGTMYLRLSMGAGGGRMSYAVQEIPEPVAGREITTYKFQAPIRDLF